MTRYPYPPADETWPPALQRLVVAVRAPAQPGELAGEDAAALSFRATRYVTPPRRTLSRVLAVKVAAGATVLVAGGYAVAAASGAVPGASFVPGPVATTPGPGSPDPHGTVDERGPGGVPGADPTRRPAESYVGLCRAYFHNATPHRDLVAAAGGANRVADFCAVAGVPAPTRPNADPKPPKTAKPAPAKPTPIKPEKSSGARATHPPTPNARTRTR